MFLQASVCPQGGVHGCSGGGVRGCSGGVVCGCSRRGMRGCSGGCAWLLLGGCGCSGGHAWLLRGACVVALGGVHGCSGGACMVAPGGPAWLLRGGVHGFFDEIRSMSGRYASYWNAFLFLKENTLCFFFQIIPILISIAVHSAFCNSILLG